MDGRLLDTNHLSAAIRKVSPVRDRLQKMHLSGTRIATCFPVLCEVEVGIQQTHRPDEFRHRLHRVLLQVRLWPMDHDIAVLYGTIALELQRRGRVLSQVDLILAAMARLSNVTLLTSDRDFEALPDIRTENWLP